MPRFQIQIFNDGWTEVFSGRAEIHFRRAPVPHAICLDDLKSKSTAEPGNSQALTEDLSRNWTQNLGPLQGRPGDWWQGCRAMVLYSASLQASGAKRAKTSIGSSRPVPRPERHTSQDLLVRRCLRKSSVPLFLSIGDWSPRRRAEPKPNASSRESV